MKHFQTKWGAEDSIRQAFLEGPSLWLDLCGEEALVCG